MGNGRKWEQICWWSWWKKTKCHKISLTALSIENHFLLILTWFLSESIFFNIYLIWHYLTFLISIFWWGIRPPSKIVKQDNIKICNNDRGVVNSPPKFDIFNLHFSLCSKNKMSTFSFFSLLVPNCRLLQRSNHKGYVRNKSE